MTRARAQQIDLQSTSYYHCISRCVRRAFLCGVDHFSGKDYSHRKGWVIERLNELANVFTIDICAYAVMSNHYHLVLRVDQQTNVALTDAEVIDRWRQLFSPHRLVQRYLKGETRAAETKRAQEMITVYRERLCDLSWYMRCLNEYLARKANEEDQCKGRFWEGRFKSQALLDDVAVLACMSYVDLNPIRAKIATTPETSDFTSIQQRIRQLKYQTNEENKTYRQDDQSTNLPSSTLPLVSLVSQQRDLHHHALGFHLTDYLALVDWSGRAIRKTKRGAIPADIPPILTRLGIDPDYFLQQQARQTSFLTLPKALGSPQNLTQFAQHLQQKFLRNCTAFTRLYCQA
jgi:REP element-mobilizing transposase RayT